MKGVESFKILKYTNMLKNKKIAFSIIAFIGLISVFFVYTRDDTISSLSLISAQIDANGNYKAPESITFIEKLGLLYLTGGLGYEFGVNNEVVETGFQTILTSDLDEMDNSSKDDNYIMNEDELKDYLENMESEQSKEQVEESEDISTETSTEEKEEIKEEIKWEELYTKESFNTTDSKGDIYRDDDIIVRYTTPIGINKSNVYDSTNIWQYNYRYLNNGLIGLETSYWASYMFQEEKYFDRAWTSLKWLCQDYLNCVIVSDSRNSFEAIVDRKSVV